MQLKRGEQWHVALQISIKQRFVRALHVFTNRATKQLKCLGTVPGATVLQTNIQYNTVQCSTVQCTVHYASPVLSSYLPATWCAV